MDTQEDLPTSDSKSYLDELVGEGRKFNSPEALAKGKWQSDNYIKILEKRLDEYREDFLKIKEESTSRARVEDLVTELRQRQTSNERTPVNEDNQPRYDQDLIESLVSSKIQEIRTSERQQENFNLVKDRLEQRYGKNYKEVVQEQINDLGISEQELNDLARKQPKFIMKTLGLDKDPPREQSTSPPRSQERTSFSPSAEPKRTWSYYQDLKKKDRNAWSDRKIAVQMQKDAIEMGDSFFDGDFYKAGLHE